MLYAILVEGLSPLGSAFTREEFTAKEVQDTDGDGLPEFVDAWGEPIQFFRWPVYYGSPGVPPPQARWQPPPPPLGTSDSQFGYTRYAEPAADPPARPARPEPVARLAGLVVEPRLTPRLPSVQQQLRQPAEWRRLDQPVEPRRDRVHELLSLPGRVQSEYVDAKWRPGGTGPAGFTRREYFTKFLILSSGPDHEPGVAQFAKDYSLIVDSYTTTLSSPYMYTFPAGRSMEGNALALIYIENQAAVSDPLAVARGRSTRAPTRVPTWSMASTRR